MSKSKVIKSVSIQVPRWPNTSTEILQRTFSGHITIPWSHGRCIVNGSATIDMHMYSKFQMSTCQVCWTRNCPACSKIEGGFKSQSIGVYSTRNHQSTDLGCLRQSVLQRTNPRNIPTPSFIVGVHMPPSSLREGGPPLDPPIRYHFFVSFFCKTDNPTQAKRPLSPPPRLLTPTHTYPSTLLDSLI